MPRRPAISVIIPYFNAREYLQAAIESVYNQTYPPKELILVDDASPEPLVQFEGQNGVSVKVIRQELNSGPAVARNRGIAEARGDFLAFLDADDYWLPKHLETLVKLIEPKTEQIICSLLKRRNSEAGQELKAEKAPSFGTALISQNIMKEVGPISEELRLSEDLEWFTRAIKNYQLKHSTVATYVYQERPGSLSSERNSNVKGMLQALRMKLNQEKRPL